MLFSSLSLFAQDELIKAELKQADRHTREGNYELALNHINKALEADPLQVIALEKKVNIMILSQKEKDITREINSKIQDSPQQAEYYYIRGLIYLYRQKSQKAIEDFDNAIIYQMPQLYMGKVYLNRGTAYYYYGDFVAAEQDFRDAVKLNPRNAAAYHSWGMMKYEEQLFSDAIKYFNKAIQYQENNSVAYYNLAMAHYKLGELKEACYNFNRSCNLNNKNGCKFYILECSE
jgi:tetratricopeptide (TPR) repeat protein